jgi:hypothetical protein
MKEFEQLARTEKQGNLVTEIWYFLSQTKKWWLLPIVVMLLGFGLLIALSGTAAAPFIYTLF